MDFMTGSFLPNTWAFCFFCSFSKYLLILFASVRQTKLAICQFLAQLNVVYRIVSYRYYMACLYSSNPVDSAHRSPHFLHPAKRVLHEHDIYK